MNIDINAPLTTRGKDYRRFLYLLDFLLLQSEDILYAAKLEGKNNIKMKEYKKRLDYIKRDMATDIPANMWEVVAAHLDEDRVKDIFLMIDETIDNA